jgi:Autographiviridae endonuclease VII
VPPAKGTPAYEAWAQTDAYRQWRDNMSAARKGRFTEAQKRAARSNVAKAKTALSARGYHFTAEQRAEMSATRKAKAEALLGPAGVIPEKRPCNKCGLVKPAADFNRDKQKRDGLRRTCRPCEKEIRDQTAEQRRRARIVAVYGVDPDWYDRTMQAQGGRCAICPRVLEGSLIVVDHDHETGEVRGLLCRFCNTGIGMLGDDPDVLDRAVEYLRRTEGGGARCASIVAAD